MSAAPMRTPLSRVRGLGSAKTGTEHFFRQRLTAIANIPLTIAAILVMISAIGRNHAAAVQILGSPLVAIVMLLFVGSICLHMKIGVQTVIEDYVHTEGTKLGLIIANIFFCCAVALCCAYAILKLSFGV